MTDVSNANTGNGHHDTPGVRTDTHKVLEELSKSNSAKSLHDRRRRGLRRFFFILLLLVPVVMMLSWLAWQQWRITTELALLRSENAALQSAMTNAPATGDVEQSTTLDPALLDELRADFESRLSSLTSTMASLQERLPAEGAAPPQERGDDEWLLTESEYLLRLANQKMQLEGDAASALFLLTTVDSMLSEATAPALFRVREAIAGEILAVRSVEAIDLAGLYARLNNLVPMVEQLSLRSTLLQNYNDRLAQQQDNAMVDQGFVARLLDLLRSVFVWQRWDVAPEALLPPQQEAVLKQNLRLMLEQAQLALLAEEQAAYHDSLLRSSDWVSQYFANDTGAGRTLREELSSLAQESIAQNRPDISGSLEALLQISEQRLPPLGVQP